MGRLYNNKSGLDEAVSGFMEGRKFKQDELYRQALQRMAADEFAKKELGGFQSPTYNEGGYYAGMEKNSANVDQAVKRYPDAYLNKPIPGTPAMPDPAVKAEENASTERLRLKALEEAKRMGTPTDPFLTPSSPGAPAMEPSPQPQQIGASQPLAKVLSPSPLLKSRDVAKQEEENAYLRDTNLNPELKIPAGTIARNASGQLVSDLNKKIDFGDKTVPGNDLPERIIPATPPVQDPTLPTLEQMAAIDRQRFSGQKDAAKNVSLGVLPPETRVALGFPADYTGEVPESLLIKMLDNLKQKAVDQFSPEVTFAIDEARKGTPPGSLIRSTEEKLKRKLNETERKAVMDSANRGEIAGRFGQNQEQQKQKFLTNYLASSRKAMRTEIRPILESYDAANTIFNLAGEPDSQGFKRAMQTMMAKASGERGQLSNSDVSGSSGVEGFWEQWEQFKSSMNNQGWTPENKETFQRLASAYMIAAKQKIQSEVENQIDSDSSILSNYNVAPTEVRNALSVDALLEGRSQKFNIPPKTIGRTKDNPTGKKPVQGQKGMSASEAKSHARRAFDILNSKKLSPVEENKRREAILKWYEKETGQSYFSEPK